MFRTPFLLIVSCRSLNYIIFQQHHIISKGKLKVKYLQGKTVMGKTNRRVLIKKRLLGFHLSFKGLLICGKQFV